MNSFYYSLFVLLLYCLPVFSTTVVSPLFPYMDGEASAYGYTGSEEDLFVDGSTVQVISWITFLTDSIDLPEVEKAYLILYVNDCPAPGDLKVYALSDPINGPENYISINDIPFDRSSPLQTISFGSNEIQKLQIIDITKVINTSTFYGIALTSENGLQVSFCSREGNHQPVVMLHTEVTVQTNISWISGEGIPAETSETTASSYIDVNSGDLYIKTEGIWNFACNIMGPKGQRGDIGPAGVSPDGNALLESINSSSGTLDCNRLPVGSSPNTIAAGVHEHKDLKSIAENNRLALLTGNLLTNADFSRGTEEWSIIQGDTVTIEETPNGPFGKKSIQNQSGDKVPTWISSNSWIPVTAEEAYLVKCAFRLTDSLAPTGAFFCAIRLRTCNEVEIPGLPPDTCWLFSVDNYIPADQQWHTISTQIGAGTLHPFPDSVGCISVGAILNSDPQNRDRAGNRIFQVQGLGISHIVVPDFGSQNIATKGNISIGGDVSIEGKITGRIFDKTGFVMPVGTVLPYAGNGEQPPSGWLYCNGDSFKRSEYQDLYNVIDTIFGKGDSIEGTFNIPDMQRMVPVGAGGAGTNTLGNKVGNIGGEEQHTLSTDEMPSHNHTPISGSSCSSPAPTVGKGTPLNYVCSYTSIKDAKTMENTGNNQPHNNLQPSLILNYIIKF
jgi:microcystin-dependent protein